MRRYRGFTLIEMVMVIVLLGIVGLSFGNIVSQGMGIYVDTTAREALAQKGRFITDRMMKELRNSVPGSVRVSNSNACVEWLPIKNTATYETIPLTADSATSLRVLPESAIDGGDRLVVFPLSEADLYGDVTSDSSVAEVSGDVAFTASEDAEMVDVPLSDTHSFPASSPARRLYIYDSPRAYCNVGKQIYLYKDYVLTRDNINLSTFSGTRVLMAENITHAEFQVVAPALQRNAQVKIELEFTDNGETLRFDHNALIHNTP